MYSVEILDRKDFEQYEAAHEHGINTNWRIRALSIRFEDMQRRNRKLLNSYVYFAIFYINP